MSDATPSGDLPSGIAEAGRIIHKLGTARMGNDPRTSVLNEYCQAHDVSNLFVTDAACFVSTFNSSLPVARLLAS
jgi:choline dehydrogenase-like flavoprotein